MPRGNFPAGTYYVGDLCYAIEEWDKFCDLTIDGHDVRDGEFPWKDTKLWTHTTAYGDGGYDGSDGRTYAVDAGLIGVLPVECVSIHDHDFTEDDSIGHIITFDEPFECVYEDGTFFIGDIVIETGDSPFFMSDDDEEDEEDDNDDE